MNKRLSPFLILGLDYGAPSDLAEQAFSRRVKALRSSSDAPYDLEDLTWALNAIQKPAEDFSSSVEFVRVPAGRKDISAGRPGDLFHPAPKPLPRTTDPLTDAERQAIRAAIATAITEMFTTASSTPHNPYTTTDGAPR